MGWLQKIFGANGANDTVESPDVDTEPTDSDTRGEYDFSDSTPNPYTSTQATVSDDSAVNDDNTNTDDDTSAVASDAITLADAVTANVTDSADNTVQHDDSTDTGTDAINSENTDTAYNDETPIEDLTPVKSLETLAIIMSHYEPSTVTSEIIDLNDGFADCWLVTSTRHIGVETNADDMAAVWLRNGNSEAVAFKYDPSIIKSEKDHRKLALALLGK